jgi:hypothetical protein
VATYATSALSVGTHSITAVYGGDANVTGSTSSGLTQTVNQTATTTVLASSKNPSTNGNSVTFTAAVTPATASGTVTFMDGSTSLGTGTLSGGAATYATSALSVGTHSITAVYSGDVNDNGSTSSVLTQTVNPSVPPTPGGLTAVAGDTLVVLSWNVSSGATNYNLKRSTTNGGPYTTIASPSVTSYTNTGLTDGTTYYYVVSAVNGSGESANSTQVSTTPVTSLPSPWQTVDIGSVGTNGSATYSGGLFTINGSGADMWGTADAFRYVYQASSGDCSMVAKILTVQNTDPWAKSGVMIRETTAAGSIYAGVFVTPGWGITFQYRNSTGGATASTYTTGLAAPYWVKLARTTSSFNAYYSATGTNWTPLGSTQKFTMATSATIGLAVCSHSAGVLCTSTSTNVTATP